MYSWEEICDRKIIELQRDSNLVKPSQQKDFKKWFMSKKGLPIAFDTLLIYRCYLVQQRLQKEYDYVTTVCGGEGDGKSVLSINYASWITPSFNREHICFRPEEFFDLLYTLNKGDSIVVDEGAIFLFSKDTMEKTNKKMIKAFTVARAKCINIVIAIPSWWILDTYIRSHRARLLLQIIRRGHYVAFTTQALRWINKEGQREKKVLGIRVKNGTFWNGTCNNVMPPNVSWSQYNQIKGIHMDEFLKEARDDITDATSKFKSASKVAKQLGITSISVKRMIQRGELDGKKIGAQWFVTRQSYKAMMKT